MVVEFGFNFVSGIAGAPRVFLARVLGQRITALNHETFDDAMETGAVIKAFLGEGLEILNGLGRGVGPKLDDHFAFGGGDLGNFVHKISWVGITWRFRRGRW